MQTHVENYCNDCCNSWTSNTFGNGICPSCSSTNVSQKAVMNTRPLKPERKKYDMQPYFG